MVRPSEFRGQLEIFPIPEAVQRVADGRIRLPAGRGGLSRRTPSKFDAHHGGCYHRNAGWSSLVARWAHNPKVGGSNPPPATNAIIELRGIWIFDCGLKWSNNN